jgi:hypothetical protein
MLAEAIQTVHTSGVNIASLASIVGGFGVVAGLMIAWLNRRSDRRETAHQAELMGLRRDFTDGISNMCNVLSARLETKDVVAAMNARLARVEGIMAGKQGLSCQLSAWESRGSGTPSPCGATA